VDNPPAKLSQDITYDWSPELVRNCTRRFILRGSRRTQALLLILLAFGIFCLVQGARAGWVLIAFCIVMVLIWVRYYFNAIKVAKERTDRQVTIRVEPDGINFRTSLQESTIKWSLIKDAWIAPDIMLLFLHGSRNYIMLPVASLGDDLRQYIETNIRQNGGKVS